MADLRTSSMGGVPKGETADRPANPSIGDVFYNGTLGCLEIYTSQGWVANSAPPGIPTIGTATYSATNKPYNNASAAIAFTPGEGGGLPNLYRATSNPGGFTATASSSPITVTGLQSATAYTFSVTGTNNFGTSAASTDSNSITANTVPSLPGTPVAAIASSTSITLTFTAGATGGSSITNYKYSTDGTNYTAFSPAQTSSPLTVTGLTENTAYTFYLKAVNANGDSAASSISNSIFTGANLSGGTLSSDSTYYYRTFTSTGNLVVSNGTLSADILVVAGGAGTSGGGGEPSGGGGAGGLVYNSTVSLTSNTYTATIGSGGSGTTYPNVGSNGVNSTFTGGSLSLTAAVGGGRGGTGSQSNGLGVNGGSGGGGSGWGDPSARTGGSGVSGQGNSGGTGRPASSAPYSSGGGGGAGAAGGDADSPTTGGGSGGAGLSTYSSWGAATSTGQNVSGTYYYAGGGGGTGFSTGAVAGAGGYGGGGAGAAVTVGSSGVSGTANTGGGGGGASGSGTGGSGGSGIVIVRYTKASVGG